VQRSRLKYSATKVSWPLDAPLRSARKQQTYEVRRARGRKRLHCRHIRAKTPLPLSLGRNIALILALARGASFFVLPPNITNAPHRALFRNKATFDLLFPSILLTTCDILHSHFAPAITSYSSTNPDRHSQDHSVSSPAWRSQQRQAIRALTSPHRVYLPGGASTPALCIPHLPLPSPVEHLQPAIFTTAST
jgi:hypothetical protein